MKLLQLNLWGGRLERQIRDLLSEQQPDIACLQEAYSYAGENLGLFLPIEKMTELLPGSSAFMSPMATFPLMKKTVAAGNTILTKLPITEQTTLFTNLEYKENFDADNDHYNIRNLQHAALDVDGRILHVLNHHGHHVPSHKDGNEDTLRQMKQIAEYVSELTGPVILTGDFNLEPHSESLEILNKILTNLAIEYNLTTTRTSLTRKTEVCDYIFVSDEVRVNQFAALDDVVSDHQALLLEFDIKQ